MKQIVGSQPRPSHSVAAHPTRTALIPFLAYGPPKHSSNTRICKAQRRSGKYRRGAAYVAVIVGRGRGFARRACWRSRIRVNGDRQSVIDEEATPRRARAEMGAERRHGFHTLDGAMSLSQFAAMLGVMKTSHFSADVVAGSARAGVSARPICSRAARAAAPH